MPPAELLYASKGLREYVQDRNRGGTLSIPVRSVEPQDDSNDLGSVHDVFSEACH